jgi:cysteine synthase
MMQPKETPHIRCDDLINFIDAPREIDIYVKNEAEQYGRSIKGRVAYAMVRRGLELGMPIVESSSGNLALGLGYWSARLGAPAPLCLIDNCCEPAMREELQRAGCNIEVVSLDPAEIENQVGVFKRVAKAREYQANGYYWPDQYDNNEWIEVHRRTTGREIWQDLIRFDLVVCAVGTGATVSGIALARPAESSALVIAVEPSGSVIFGGHPGPYGVAGAGNPFTPRNYRKEAIDMEIVIDDVETFGMARYLRRAGYAIGSSGSMVVVGAGHALRLLSNKSRAILVVIADDGWYENLLASWKISGKWESVTRARYFLITPDRRGQATPWLNGSAVTCVWNR